MTLVTFNAETGTNGTTLTPANTGFSVMVGGANNTFASAAAAHGSLGYKFIAPSGVQDLGRVPPDTAGLVMAFRGYFQYVATPVTVNRVLLIAQNSSRSAFNIFLDTTNNLVIQDEAYSHQVVCSETLSAGTWYRLEVLLSVGTTSTNGSYSVNYYLLDSTTPVNPTPYTSSTYDLGTTSIVGFDIGCNDTAATALTTYWDDLAINSGGTTQIGPYSSGTNATVNAVPAHFSVLSLPCSVTATTVAVAPGPAHISFAALPCTVSATQGGPAVTLHGSGTLTVGTNLFDPTIFSTVYGRWIHT